MKKSRYTGIALGAFIAAAYAVLTYSSAFFGLAYGGVQFRVSEALTILSIFTPYAIPGLAVGCILGNLTSPYGIIDIICGTSATFFAAVAAYLLRKIKIKNLPLLSISMPIFANGVIVGAEIAFFMPEGFAYPVFFLQGGLVAVGESVVILLLGVPFYIFLRKRKKNLFELT